MTITLATTYHDGKDRMYDQIVHALPILTRVFDGIAVQASPAAPPRSLAALAHAGARIGRDDPRQPGGAAQLGRIRRAALALALQQQTTFLLYFDFDSMLHWVQHYPDEFAAVVARIPDHDMTIIGRSQRALDSHPHSQRETELFVNHAFAHLSGYAWDVMRSGRGLSWRAAEAIVAECAEEGISADVVWPLFLLRKGDFSIDGIAIEGTEFETPDRYGPEIVAAGGYAQWLRQIDADPRRWAHRLHLARMHVEAMIPYAGPDTHLETRLS
jgi:hypothetical protein